jgi:hypothetical protein
LFFVLLEEEEVELSIVFDLYDPFYHGSVKVRDVNGGLGRIEILIVELVLVHVLVPRSLLDAFVHHSEGADCWVCVVDADLRQKSGLGREILE